MSEIVQVITNISPFFGFLGFVASLLSIAFAKWLDIGNSGKLQEQKHSHEEQIEQLRYQIRRTSRADAREMEVLHTVWIKLLNAQGSAARLISPSREYPDITKLTDDELEAFLADQKFGPSDRRQVLEAPDPDRESLYHDRLFWHRYDRVDRLCTEFNNYLLYNKIFIEASLYVLLQAAHKHMATGLDALRAVEEMQQQYGRGQAVPDGYKLRLEAEKNIESATGSIEGIGDRIRECLYRLPPHHDPPPSLPEGK